MLHLTPVSLDPHSINHGRRWSLSRDLPLDINDSLAASIHRFSILHPPIVRKYGGNFEVICGTRRINAARRLPTLQQISCLLLDGEINSTDLLKLIAEEQLLSGPLSPIQTARLIMIASECEEPPDPELLALLTGMRSISKRSQLTRILDLEEPIRLSIHHGKCSVQSGLFLLELSEKDRAVLFAIFSRLSLNKNKQRRVIDLCRIIAANRQSAIADIFRTDYPELIDGPIDNIPQKTAHLMRELYHKSHPLSSRAEEIFAGQVKGLKLPGNCRISHSPSFEQDTVTLEIDFPGFKDCEHKWQKIKQHLK